MTVLQLDDVTISYDQTTEPALDSVSLRVPVDESVAVIGPSGAGKTTLLRLASGALKPDSGRVLVDGESDPDRRDTALVYQEHALIERRSALSNALVGRLDTRSWLRGLIDPLYPTDSERAIDLLEMAGIGEKSHTRVDELSSGERQRVACVRALLQDASILLADEPTANLDPTTSRTILELLHQSRVDQALLVVMHDIGLALDTFDRVIGIRDGQLVFDRTATALSETAIERLFEQEDESSKSPPRTAPKQR